jgi:glycosyltransferase involved in cell wall biosynthesis
VVTVTTSALAERYGHGRGVVLRNVVPDWYLDVRPKHPLRAIGWTGVIDAHARDLHVTGGVVGDLLDEHDDWDFAVVGEDRFIGTALGLKREVLATGMLPLDEYALAMAEITVGIVPLEANAFNAAKSALKMAQFAALGVPVVASPSPDNCRLHELGVGELADSPDEWRRKLERLVESEEARAELAHRGRAVMAGQTYERHAGRWWAAWTGEG